MAQKEHELKWLFDSDMRNSIGVQLFDYKNGLPSAREELHLKKGCIATLGARAEAADELPPSLLFCIGDAG